MTERALVRNGLGALPVFAGIWLFWFWDWIGSFFTHAAKVPKLFAGSQFGNFHFVRGFIWM
jgi:hypothetical protein